jgi:hypothetical protein
MKHVRISRAITLDDTVIGAAVAKQIAGSSPNRCRVIVSTPPDATTYTVAFGQDATATKGFWLSANRPWLDFARREYGEWIGQAISVFSAAGGAISIGQVMEYEEECDCYLGRDHYETE